MGEISQGDDQNDKYQQQKPQRRADFVQVHMGSGDAAGALILDWIDQIHNLGFGDV